MNPDRTILRVLQTEPPAMFNAELVIALIITVLLIAAMYFFLSYLPKKFPKQARGFRDFYFGYEERE